jgi:hypothetical protein
VAGESTAEWPGDSIFASAQAASAFFAAGSVGYSHHPRRGDYECMELCVPDWQATAFAVSDLAASYFDDAERFAPGSIRFDHALLMRGIEHEWRLRDPIAGVAGRAVHSPRSDTTQSMLQV